MSLPYTLPFSHSHFSKPTLLLGGFVHSTPCHTKPVFLSQYCFLALDSPSPLTPLTSLESQNSSPLSPILSNLTPSLSLSFLFDPTFFLLISNTNPLLPLFTPSELSSSSASLLCVSILLPTSILSILSIPIPPPTNQVQIPPPAMAQ